MYTIQTSDKSKRVAFILCLFGGFAGLHHFYVGRITTGLVYLFTLGLFGIGWAFDLLLIALGAFRDNVNAPLRR
jgi:TM2 domain-containing membrane protein YozV